MMSSIDERSIEQSIETRVKTAFEKCESRIGEVVNTVIEKKRLNLKSMPFRKKLTRKKSLRNITMFYQAFAYGVYLKT